MVDFAENAGSVSIRFFLIFIFPRSYGLERRFYPNRRKRVKTFLAFFLTTA